MTMYNPNDDNPIQETDRIEMHPTNPGRVTLDPSMATPPYNTRSGWSWKTIFEYLATNLWQSEPVGMAMTWYGTWTAGLYNPGNVVVDGLWTMIANKQTSDKPAPVLAGSPIWMTDANTPSWTTQSPVTSLVVTGAQFTAGDTQDMALGARVYIPAFGVALTYRFILREVLGDDLYRDISNTEFVPLATGWYDFVGQGIIFDIAKTYQMLLMASDDTTTVDFNGRWGFTYGTGNTTPGAGEIYNRTSVNELRVHNIDANADPQGTDLDTVVAGTEIQFANGAIFTVDEVIGSTVTVHTFHGNFTGFPAVGFQNVDFRVPVDTATDYVEELAYWTTNPPGDNATIQGMISKGGNPFTFDDVLYGVDLLFDEVVSSPDWDVVALSDDLTP